MSFIEYLAFAILIIIALVEALAIWLLRLELDTLPAVETRIVEVPVSDGKIPVEVARSFFDAGLSGVGLNRVGKVALWEKTWSELGG